MKNKLILIYRKYEEIFRYLIVGVLTTIVSLGSYYICVLTFLDPNNPIELQIANILSWITCVTFAYFANRSFVFKSKNENKVKELASFYTSRITTLLMDAGVMFIFVTWLGFNDKIIKLLVQVIVTIANYIFSKIFVFKKEKK